MQLLGFSIHNSIVFGYCPPKGEKKLVFFSVQMLQVVATRSGQQQCVLKMLKIFGNPIWFKFFRTRKIVARFSGKALTHLKSQRDEKWEYGNLTPKKCTLVRWNFWLGTRSTLTASLTEVKGRKSTEFMFAELCWCHLITRSLAEDTGMRSKGGIACEDNVLETLCKIAPFGCAAP